MGSDLSHMMDRIVKERGKRYTTLKRQLCDALGMEYRTDVTGPGDDIGPTDDELVEAVRQLVSVKRELE